MKRGDIFLNKFGGVRENRIICYIGNDTFIFLGRDGFHKGHWNLKDKYHDGTPNLELIGHSDFLKILAEDLKKFQDTQNEYETFIVDKENEK